MTNNISKTVYFGNLNNRITANDLCTWAAMFGETSNPRIIPNKTNPRGPVMGFVDFETEEQAQACVEHFEKYPMSMMDNQIWVKIATSQPKSAEQRSMEALERRNSNYQREERRTYNGGNYRNQERRTFVPRTGTQLNGHAKASRHCSCDNEGNLEYERIPREYGSFYERL